MNVTVFTAGNQKSVNGDAVDREVAIVNTMAVAASIWIKRNSEPHFCITREKTGNKAYIGKEPTSIEE
ncbi:MAG TPA: hypothetical protein PLU94_05835 [Methanoregulaceae archaeon]|nr:MAG: hypothetical protein BWY93_01581 [Euryarchaeota archaeon ADurb.BinA087]HPH34995.1 hypothetical protein [Methanoregulaceae archaeon]HPM62676.1 hypothetical protein [Methanoregulaceae archaeon]